VSTETSALVLVVHRDPTLTMLLTYALQTTGYATLSATSAVEALQAVALHGPQVVVLDPRLRSLARTLWAPGAEAPQAVLTVQEAVERLLGPRRRPLLGMASRPSGGRSPTERVGSAFPGLPGKQANALRRAGFRSLEEAAGASDERLLAVPGIGRAGLALVRGAGAGPSPPLPGVGGDKPRPAPSAPRGNAPRSGKGAGPVRTVRLRQEAN
jgi:CheY-like chemotaxis protein